MKLGFRGKISDYLDWQMEKELRPVTLVLTFQDQYKNTGKQQKLINCNSSSIDK